MALERLNIVKRAEWGAVPPRRAPIIIQPEDRFGVVLHWNGPAMKLDGSEPADRAKVLAIHNYHRFNDDGPKWSDSAYSYEVGQSGTIYEVRGLLWDQFANGSDQVGANDGTDRQWYTIMTLIGVGEEPSAAAVASIKKLVVALRQAGAGDRVISHSDIRRKACPGPHLQDLAKELDQKPIVSAPVMAASNNGDGIEDALKRVRATRRRAETTITAMNLAEASLTKELNR